MDIKTLAWKVGLPVLAVACAVIAVFLIVTMYQRWGQGALILSLFLVKAVIGVVICIYARETIQRWKAQDSAAKEQDLIT
ncbi:hypothetical protein FE391_33665 [Nonomuraea sp. KC401]|uniref:hypothetical protein n=1 Tax=unclassified Nonomuraea TaxID=2593643 RepID=UPI0010FE0E5E|nr:MULTISPECIES: hypothetical protein [unclassified Nonomuraea]NBE98118.1 hypothetical protein [Nonomuraea sp. K271]TLF60424.1 hypothetical protein FE391_33665 [Nonomuraea sp. KC401]